MNRCPNCSAQVPEGTRFCPDCGTPLVQAHTPTQTSLHNSATRATPPPPVSLPHSTEARFLPGTVVATRYRIIGLLGRGGMGEVYRADDLKLGQAVALKFLPQEVERDDSRLQRFLNEVRLALRITHPNVCRVHDIGEVDGQHFISMEYVDGEDLSSLLRRIGRLPQERAIEIARQMCSGLAAAHDEGILHRDLKPANIMIDGRGRARITDFGLAGLSGTVHGDEVQVGTPAYMAPEQRAGTDVSKRSDIYSLGLVLYEMFTGKPAFSPQQTSPPSTLTSLVKGLDPAIESVVMRALDKDPAKRPASALALAAALPGGDPLAAALAAGETPSPEMVAAAGDKGGLAPGWVALCLLLLVAGILAIGAVRPRTDVFSRIEAPHSISALRERTRLMVERLGFDEAPTATAHGVTVLGDYHRWLRDEQASDMSERVAAGRPPVYALWYRQAPERMTPRNPFTAGTTLHDPPIIVPGMLGVLVDPQGRLVELESVPADRDDDMDPAAPESVDVLWAALFTEAELDPGRFSPIAPSYRPPFFADARAAWEGTLEEAPETTLRVEAAALDGRPVWFRIVGPWTRDRGSPADESTFARVRPFIFLGVALSLLSGLALLARRNLHQGRSDLKGATRIGLYLFTVELISRLFGILAHVDTEWGANRIFVRLSQVVFLSALVFLAYVALEPYVRRIWPTALIAWTRLLSGRVRDPLVGRDLLIGAVAGTTTAFLGAIHTQLLPVLGLPEEPLGAGSWAHMIGGLETLSRSFTQLGGSVGVPMLMMVALVLIRLLLRNTTAAIALLFVFSVMMQSLGSDHVALEVALNLIVMGLTLFVVLRIGLLAGVSMWFFDWACGAITTLDPSSWPGTAMVVSVLMMLVPAGWFAFVALGGRTLLQEEV